MLVNSDEEDATAGVEPTMKRRSKKSHYPVNISHEKKYIDLQMWLKANGVRGHHLRPAAFHDTGRGLMATKAIKNDDIIISIPKRLLITSQVVLKSDLGESLKCSSEKLTPRLLLCAFLIHERHRGPSSFWSPYINCLPEEFDTPAYFTKEEVDLLPSNLRTKAVEQQNIVSDGFKKLNRFFHFAKSQKNIECAFPSELFMWAWFVVNTRTLYMEQDHMGGNCVDRREEDVYMLAPFLDLLNHSPTVQVSGAFNESKQCYEIISATPFSKYDQVFIHYGPHDNEKLLLEYGFMVPSNPHNVVAILLEDIVVQIQLVNHAIETPEERCDLIGRNRLWDLSCSADGLSWHLTLCLSILCLGTTDYKQDKWKGIINGSSQVPADCQIRSEKAAALILRICLERMSEECQVLAAVPDQTCHTRMILQLYQEKRVILEECLSAVNGQH